MQGATRSSLAQLPGGGRSSAVALSGIANTWPSLQHEAQMNAPGSPLGRSSDLAAMAAERQAAAMAASSSGLPPHRQQYAPKRAQSADLAGARAAAARGAAAPLNGRPMSSVPTGTSRTSFGRGVPPLPGQQVLSSRSSASPGRRSASPPLGAAATAVVSIVTASGAHVNAGPRGAPLLIQQLQREVEQLRDELLYQHELAEASAAKVRASVARGEVEGAVDTGIGEWDDSLLPSHHPAAVVHDTLHA